VKPIVIVSVVYAVLLCGSATAKLVGFEPSVQGITSLGVPRSWLPRLAVAEIAGAIGVLVGLAVAWIGVLAALGLVAYYAGAVIAHRRADDSKIAPAIFLGVVALAILGHHIGELAGIV
jgi:uncharacterized membrane protein YphA (DoxX/SURF4 family)